MLVFIFCFVSLLHCHVNVVYSIGTYFTMYPVRFGLGAFLSSSGIDKSNQARAMQNKLRKHQFWVFKVSFQDKNCPTLIASSNCKNTLFPCPPVKKGVKITHSNDKLTWKKKFFYKLIPISKKVSEDFSFFGKNIFWNFLVWEKTNF